MNQQEIQTGIKLLCKTSSQVKSYYSDDQNIVDALNKADLNDLKKCAEYYSDRSGVVVDIRKELINRLINKEVFSVKSLNELIAKYKTGRENQFRAYKETFAIVFPVITFYGHNPERDFIKLFTLKLIGDLNISEHVKEVSFDFQGVRQQGNDRYWVAIYNKVHKNQSIGIQFFFEFYDGNISYGVYRHEDKSFLKARVTNNPEDFSYDNMLSYFEPARNLIIEDVPKYDDLVSIPLNGHKLYKISLGSFKAQKYKDIIETFKKNNWIVLHENTKKGQADDFKSKLVTGDYVYITVGSNELIAIAKVISDDWEYVPNDIVDSDAWIYREVEIVQPAIRNKPQNLTNKRAFYPSANSTFSEVKEDFLLEANDLLFKPYFNAVFNTTLGKDSLEHDRKNRNNQMNPELNQILYGPPGTGKTFNTINKALELCGEEIIGLDRTKLKELFEEKVENGQVVFTTFHQSMTYEDFVEGIKPIEPEKEGDPVIYKVVGGIFRNLCIEASFAMAKENRSEETEKVLDFSLVYDNFLQKLEEKLSTESTVELSTKNGGKVYVESISAQGNIQIKHHGGSRIYTVSKQRLSKLQKGIKNLEEVSNINDQFRSVIGGSNSSAYWSVLNEIRNDIKPAHGYKSAERKFTWEEKKEVVLGLKNEDYKNIQGKPYVLIVDEINRGNVSQIFGELITLIEEDKRLGKKEAIDVCLPYSKERFGVPPNLHIIGTMNTADRSIEALDTALRRRFSFVHVPPKPEIIRTEGVLKATNGLLEGLDLAFLLSTINRRIEKLLDKDHMIGHSYFLSVKNMQGLKETFKNKIIPLLQEYFFGDYGKIGLVIGAGFFEDQDNEIGEDFFADFDYETGSLLEKKVYHLLDPTEMIDREFISAINQLMGQK